jgi:hypothetical protein
MFVPMPAVPFQTGEPMVAMTREEIVRDISIALAVMSPAVQFGHGRKLPHEGDAERHWAAELIVEYFERRRVSWFRPPTPPLSAARK